MAAVSYIGIVEYVQTLTMNLLSALNLFPSGITGTSECTGGFIPATKPGCAAGAVTDYYFTVTCP